MDLCIDGRTEVAIQALAHARLTATSMRLIAEAGSCRLVTQGPYRLQLRIELADLGATTGGGCHEAEGLIRFPRHMELSSRRSAG